MTLIDLTNSKIISKQLIKSLAVSILLLIGLVFIPNTNSYSVAAQTAAKAIDKGDFKVGFSPATLKKNPKKVMDKEVAQALLEVTTPLNELLALPYDVYLNFDECGEPNAFYNPQTKEITVCYEFLAGFEEAFKTITNNQDEINGMSESAMVVFLFHELGHCLIDVWDLPTTGREEDTVDQLAIFLILDGTPEGEQMVLTAATYFAITSEQNEELTFWGEHSLNQQRFYDMLCLTYGGNPEKNKNLLGEDGLPEERAERCPEEYEKVDRTWKKLLAPYLK